MHPFVPEGAVESLTFHWSEKKAQPVTGNDLQANKP